MTFRRVIVPIRSQFVINCHCALNIVFPNLENVKTCASKRRYAWKFYKLFLLEENTFESHELLAEHYGEHAC